MNEYRKILNLIAEAQKPVVVVIDGRAASGKTTLAAKLSDELNAAVIHMDDFFLPVEKRTPERFSEPGGNVDYERFASEILPNLKSGKEFTYGVFDCAEMKISSLKNVNADDVLIVEGAYSLHPEFGNYADIPIFVNVSSECQLKRIKKRNGSELLKRFKNEWIPMEELYFKTYSIPSKCKVLINCENE